MREIKFRAKIKGRKKLIYDFCLTNNGTVFQLRKNGKTELLDIEELTQYTGLKDNTKWEQLTPDEQEGWLSSGKTKEEWNGKKVYEGDIIKFQTIKGVVEYTNACAFEVMRKVNDLYDNTTIEEGEPLSSYYEVIGNIHENPELLKEKT